MANKRAQQRAKAAHALSGIGNVGGSSSPSSSSSSSSAHENLHLHDFGGVEGTVEAKDRLEAIVKGRLDAIPAEQDDLSVAENIEHQWSSTVYGQWRNHILYGNMVTHHPLNHP
jgi:hypothetical protein